MSPLMACIIGISLALLYFFTTYRSTDVIKKSMAPIRKQKQDLTLELQNMNKVINDAIEYQQTINMLGATINKVIKYIPETMTSSIMMRRLTEAASVSGVNIINVKDSRNNRNQKGQSNLYEKVPVKISLEGNFNQIMVFLANLTKLDTIFTISDLKIKTAIRRNSGRKVEFSATFIGYRYKGEEGLSGEAG